jgi:hypothetical protein
MMEVTLGLFMKVGVFGVKTASSRERGPTPAPLVAEIL